MSGEVFYERMLEEVGVVVVNGSGFGVGGEDFVRFSFAMGNLEMIKEGIERIGKVLGWKE